jgi:hypothetical protein
VIAGKSEAGVGKSVPAGFAAGDAPRGVHDGTEVFTVWTTGEQVEPFQLETCTS